MAGEWPEVPLADLVDPLRGISYGIVQPGQTGADGVPIVRVSNVRNGRIETESPLRVSADIERAYSRTRLRGGEILITIVGTIGETAIVPPELAGWNVARAIAVIPVKPDIGSYWVRVALGGSDAAAMIHSRLNTTVQATLNLRDLARLPVLLPPAPERKAIAHILGTLDDRIEANRRMAATLEEMARALFRAWFVTFEPVRAKAEGRWRRGQTLPGLPASLYDAFPNRLVETEHGEIPEGWRWGTMADVLELAYGRALKATDRRSGPYPVYGSGGITGYHDEALVEGPTVIVGRKGSVGTLYWADESCFPIDTVFYVVPRSPLTFCFYLLATLGLDGMNTDAAVPGLNRNNVYRLDVQIPLGLMVSEFDRITRNVRARIRAVLQETQVLAVLRDTLLPKLVSGTIRVKDAEAFLKARGL